MLSKSDFCRILIAAVVLLSFSIKNSDQKPKEYLSVPGPVEFSKTNFSLSWSSHPNNNYYKQEYLPANEKSETFTKMIMIEALVGDMTAKDAMMAKKQELEERKKTDPVTNYDVIQNPTTGEYLLDFVISSGDIVEWNVYRYTNLKDGSTKGLALFAYSKRGYGTAGTKGFLTLLKTERKKDINTMAAYKIPSIKIKSK